ncbi:hypothetical protein HBI21_087380 [Parastagonospora nodorum]|nr:hypothetical protein HBI21_087380 [Parastagonospora nodorum]KAH5997981.1 hypothetical protein HBI84_113060 [Parastagonospora nodorum]
MTPIAANALREPTIRRVVDAQMRLGIRRIAKVKRRTRKIRRRIIKVEVRQTRTSSFVAREIILVLHKTIKIEIIGPGLTKILPSRTLAEPRNLPTGTKRL